MVDCKWTFWTLGSDLKRLSQPKSAATKDISKEKHWILIEKGGEKDMLTHKLLGKHTGHRQQKMVAVKTVVAG
jgi:hypothetical protein